MDIEAQETDVQQRSSKRTIWNKIFGTNYIYISKGWTRSYLLIVLTISILLHIAALIIASAFYRKIHKYPAEEKHIHVVSKVSI